MKHLIFLFIATASFFSTFSQNKFQISYSQTSNDFNNLNAIKRVADGFIMVGSSGSTSSNLNDLIVMKTDFNMSALWSKKIGTTGFDEKIEYLSKCVVFETDGIVILGNTTQTGTRDFLLTKVDYSGSILWSKSYGFPISGSNYNDNASALCKTSNGYYLCGYLNTATTGY